jgi:ACS family glucarate transporter-like MFS transporter
MKDDRWGLVALLCATATAGYLCRVNVSVAGALLMGEFGLSQVQMGRVFSAFLLGYALFQVPGGMLADRWGARRVVAIVAWWWVLATLLQALVGWGPLGGSAAGVLWMLVALRFVLGVGAAPTYPASAQGIAKWIPPSARGRANGIVIGSVGLGSALAPPIVSAVMVGWGWRAAWSPSSAWGARVCSSRWGRARATPTWLSCTSHLPPPWCSAWRDRSGPLRSRLPVLAVAPRAAS